MRRAGSTRGTSRRRPTPKAGSTTRRPVIVRGDWVDPAAGKVTFRQWWHEWATSQDWAAGTKATADQVIASIAFAEVPIRAVTENHVRQWMKATATARPEEKSGSGCFHASHAIQLRPHVLCRGGRARLIRLDPTAAITPPKVPKAETKMRIPSARQVAQALDAAPQEFRAFIAVCAFAGLRLGEAAGVQLGDVDFLRRTLSVERQIQGQVNGRTVETSPKYESARIIYLPDDLVTMLSQTPRTDRAARRRTASCSRFVATSATATAPATSGAASAASRHG